MNIDTTLLLQPEEELLSSFPTLTHQATVNEKPLYFQLPVPSHGLLVHNNLPNLPLLSLKKQALGHLGGATG